jgi:cytochrome P450
MEFLHYALTRPELLDRLAADGLTARLSPTWSPRIARHTIRRQSVSMVTVLDLLGFDPFAPDFLRAPYQRYRELRKQGPLFRTSAGMWLATGYAPCAALLRDPRFGHGEGPPGRSRSTRSFLVMDPPDHTRLRALVSRAFTARMIERLRPRISAIAEELVGEMSGEVDLISALAYPLPVRVISEMLGVPPEDQARFQGWSESLARGLDPDFMLPEKVIAERDAARIEFHAYFAELLVRRRTEPGQDLLSAKMFADPDRLDLDRGPGRHLAFGLGAHFCLGAPLARLEGAVALSALATAAPNLTLVDPAPPYKKNLTLRGLAALPVRLSPSA